VKAAEKQLSSSLGRKVTIQQGKKKGKLALEYYDQEDLQALLTALETLGTGREA
jgi:ParB family chromosome partitioning protein